MPVSCCRASAAAVSALSSPLAPSPPRGTPRARRRRCDETAFPFVSVNAVHGEMLIPSCRVSRYSESEDKGEAAARRRKTLPSLRVMSLRESGRFSRSPILQSLYARRCFSYRSPYFREHRAEQPLVRRNDDAELRMTRDGGANSARWRGGINMNYTSLISYDVFPSAINISPSNVPVYSNILLLRPEFHPDRIPNVSSLILPRRPSSPPPHPCSVASQERAAILRGTARSSDRPAPSIFDFPSKINGWT